MEHAYCAGSARRYRRGMESLPSADADRVRHLFDSEHWCTAEFVSDGKCGIGIETIPAYRGRGFATVTASAFLEHCAERAMTPLWDAWVRNVPSAAVAEKVGLEKVETYAIYVCEFDDIAAAGSAHEGPD